MRYQWCRCIACHCICCSISTVSPIVPCHEPVAQKALLLRTGVADQYRSHTPLQDLTSFRILASKPLWWMRRLYAGALCNKYGSLMKNPTFDKPQDFDRRARNDSYLLEERLRFTRSVTYAGLSGSSLVLRCRVRFQE